MSKRTDRSQAAVASGVPEQAWRRLHPLTPLSRIGAVLAVLMGWALIQNFELLVDIIKEPHVQEFGITLVVLIVTGIVLAVIILVGLYSYMAWRHAGFAITDQAVYYRSGILLRSQRHARLSRIQSVNIKYGFVGRLLGLGQIDIEVAGGSDSSLSFGLLTKSELEGVRREVMVQAQAAKRGSLTGGEQNRVAPQEQPQPVGNQPVDTASEREINAFDGLDNPDHSRIIYRVSPVRLLASVLANHSIVVALIVAVVLLSISMIRVILTGFSFSSLPTIIGGLSIFGFAWSSFSSDFGFTASITADGIRVEAGLLSTRSQTFPPQRIHAVRVTQPFLWRYFGWYRLDVSQAGFNDNEEKGNQASSVLLPVGTREQLELAMWLVFPHLGVNDPIRVLREGIDADRFHPTPTAHSHDIALTASENPEYLANPMRSRIFDWFAYKRRALAMSRTHLFLRDGWLNRTLIVLPYARLQGVSVNTGPWAKRRGLAKLRAHLAGDSSKIVPALNHLDIRVAANALEQIRTLSLIQRERESLPDWRRRVNDTETRGFNDSTRSTAPTTGTVVATQLETRQP